STPLLRSPRPRRSPTRFSTREFPIPSVRSIRATPRLIRSKVSTRSTRSIHGWTSSNSTSRSARTRRRPPSSKPSRNAAAKSPNAELGRQFPRKAGILRQIDERAAALERAPPQTPGAAHVPVAIVARQRGEHAAPAPLAAFCKHRAIVRRAQFVRHAGEKLRRRLQLRRLLAEAFDRVAQPFARQPERVHRFGVLTVECGIALQTLGKAHAQDQRDCIAALPNAVKRDVAPALHPRSS